MESPCLCGSLGPVKMFRLRTIRKQAKSRGGKPVCIGGRVNVRKGLKNTQTHIDKGFKRR